MLINKTSNPVKMSANGRKKAGVRPLGAVRQPIQPSYERTTRLTNFSSIPNKNSNQSYEIQGSAMQVPPPKEEKEREEVKIIKPVVKSGKSDSGSSTKSQEKENVVDKKELTEAKVSIFDVLLSHRVGGNRKCQYYRGT